MVSLSEYETHILEKWYESGTVSQGAGGLLPLEWQAIESWANLFYTEEYVEWVEQPVTYYPNGRERERVYTPVLLKQCVLSDAELKLIRQLSQEYCSMYAEASNPACPCPKQIVLEDITEDEAVANADAIAEGFKLLFGNQDDKSVEVVQNK